MKISIPSWSERSYFLNISVLFLISLVLRIPRNLKITGNDAFIVSFYAILVEQGTSGAFLLNPLSYLGVYPLSSYPMLSIWIVAFYYAISGNVIFSWYSMVVTISLIGVVCTYNLFLAMNLPKYLPEIITIMYLSHPMFVLFSLGSISTRATFMAFLPLFILTLFKWMKFLHWKYLLHNTLSLLILLLSHRIALLLIPVFLLSSIFGGILIISKKQEDIYSYCLYVSSQYYKRIIVSSGVVFIILGIASTYIFPLVEVLVGPSGYFSFEPGVIAFIELMILSIVNAGVLPILSFILLGYRVMKPNKNDYITEFAHLRLIEVLSVLTIAIFALGMTISWYSNILFALPLSILAGLSIHQIATITTRYDYKLYIIGSTLVIGFILSTLIVLPSLRYISSNYVIIYSLIFISILLIQVAGTFYFLTKKKNHLKFTILILLMLMLFQSFYYTDTLTSSQDQKFPYPYLSTQERQMADILVTLNIDGRVISSHDLVAKRLMGLTGVPFYEDQFGGSSLVQNTVNRTDVKQNLSLLPITQWWEGPSIFDYNESLNIRNLRIPLFYSHFEDSFVQEIFQRENTNYLITTQDFNFTTIWFSSKSNLIEDIVLQFGSLVYSNNELALYHFERL